MSKIVFKKRERSAITNTHSMHHFSPGVAPLYIDRPTAPNLGGVRHNTPNESPISREHRIMV